MKKDENSGDKMSFRGSLFLFIIVLFVEVVCPVTNKFLSADKCVRFKWNHEFASNFFPENNQYNWKNRVLNIINDCLNRSTVKKANGKCNSPILNVSFPLISCKPNVTLKTLRRPVLVIKEVSSGTGNQVLNALKNIWKVFVLSIMAAVLSGIVIWFLDHRANSGHFPNSFMSGVREGLWWAVVTMTTVGYGDKTPKSSLARVYASLWMIIGMLLMSTITAQISSSITADELRPLDEIFGSEVSVPLGSKQFFEEYNRGAVKVKEYSTKSELLRSLKNNGIMNKIWLLDCDKTKMQEDFTFTIVKSTYESPSVGVKIQVSKRHQENVTHCLENKEMSGDDNEGDRDMTAESETSEHYTAHEDNDEENDCFKNHSRGKYRHDTKKGSSESPLELIDFILLGFAAVLVTLLSIGALWNAYERKKPATIGIDIEKGLFDEKLRAKISSELHMEELATASMNYNTEQNASKNMTH